MPHHVLRHGVFRKFRDLVGGPLDPPHTLGFLRIMKSKDMGNIKCNGPVRSTRVGTRMLVWWKPLSFGLLNLISSSSVNMSSFFRLHCSWRRFVEHHLMVTLPFLHPLVSSLIRVVRALRTTLTSFGLLESGEECFLHFPAQHRQPNFFLLLLLCKTEYFFGFFKDNYSNLEK